MEDEEDEMGKVMNLKEARKLVRWYRNTTKELIEKVINEDLEYYTDSTGETWVRIKNGQKYNGFRLEGKFGEMVANRLTGFGFFETCSLCIIADNDCGSCIWAYENEDTSAEDSFCIESDERTRESYGKIKNAKTADELLSALHERADLLEEVIARYEKKKSKKK